MGFVLFMISRKGLLKLGLTATKQGKRLLESGLSTQVNQITICYSISGRGLIAESPLTLTSRWIESHQDDNKPLIKLDLWGKLHVECDGLAKGFWNSCALTKTWIPGIAFGFEKWSLWIAGKKLSKMDKTNLYAYTFTDRTCKYWHRKHSLTPNLIMSINWLGGIHGGNGMTTFRKEAVAIETCYRLLQGGSA
jgi:hypothetical protein